MTFVYTAKNTSAMQTTTLQNRKADVYFPFFNCILLWTALYSSGAMRARLSAFCVDEGDDFSFHDRNSQILFPLTRAEFAAAQGLPWHQTMLHGTSTGLQSMPLGALHDRGSFVSKLRLGCCFDVVADLLLFPVLCLFSLSLSPALALSSI